MFDDIAFIERNAWDVLLILTYCFVFAEAENNGEKNGVTGRPVSPMPTGPLPNGTSWQSCRKLIFVPRSAQRGYTVGHWPIPESFWPDINNDTLVSMFVIACVIQVHHCC